MKSMKGMAIGTIIPWSGPISGDFGVPKGWLACTLNKFLNIDDYPELYDIIGNRYGGTVGDGTFALPSLPGKSLGDYHPSHATELGYTGNFASFLGTSGDLANSNITIQSSNIDVRLTLGSFNDLQGSMTGMNINASTYSTTFGFVPRRLGDGHMGSHSHGGTYESIRVSDVRLERCQPSGAINCANVFNCGDDCGTFQIFRCGQTNDSFDDFCIPIYDGGQHLGRAETPYGTSGYRMARTNTEKNYLLPEDDTILYNETSAIAGSGDDGDWSGIYGTTLNTNIVRFQTASMGGHDHNAQSLSINTGNTRTKETVKINSISDGTIAPVNLDNREVMTITVDTNTPSIQMMYIIKGY
jgi:hypothetical protein